MSQILARNTTKGILIAFYRTFAHSLGFLYFANCLGVLSSFDSPIRYLVSWLRLSVCAGIFMDREHPCLHHFFKNYFYDLYSSSAYPLYSLSLSFSFSLSFSLYISLSLFFSLYISLFSLSRCIYLSSLFVSLSLFLSVDGQGKIMVYLIKRIQQTNLIERPIKPRNLKLKKK